MSDPTIGLKPLVSEMIGKDCLNNWDMLVSYNEGQLNELLKRRSETVTGISDMAPFDVPIKSNPFDPGPGDLYTMALKLAKPLMRFTEGTKATIDLTFELSGTSTNKETKVSVPLQPGLLLKASSSLLSVQGTTSGGLEDLAPSPDKPPLPAKTVVLLEPGKVHGVCIDLREPTVVITHDEKPGGEKVDQAILDSYSINLSPYIAAELKRAAALKYYIAGVSPALPGSTANLKPTSFCFSSTTGKLPALLMWIGVEGGNGNGSASVSFHPDSLDRSPIPEGSTASLLISHDIMATKFIQTSLESAGFSSIVSLNGKTKEGMKFNVNCPPMREVKDNNTRNILRVDTFDRKEHGAWQHVDGIDIDVSATAAQLVLRSPRALRGSSPPSPIYNERYEQIALDDLFEGGKHKDKDAILSWISPQQTVNWRWSYRQTGDIISSGEDGVDKVDYSFAASADWTGGANQLSMSWTIDSEFHSHMDSLNKASVLDSLFGHDPEAIPKSYTDFNPKFPTSFKIDMTPLNYFLATNLLFLGEHIFVPDEPSNTSETKGLGIPRDTILTGSIVSPPSNLAKVVVATHMRKTTTSLSGFDSPTLTVNNAQAQSPVAEGSKFSPSEAALKFIKAFGDVTRDDPLYKHLFEAAGLDRFGERDAAFDKAFQKFGLTVSPDELIALIGWDRKAFLKAAGAALPENGGELPASKANHASESPPTRALQSNIETELSLDLMKPWATVYDTSNGSMFVVYPDTGYFGYPYKKNSSARITPKVLSAKQAQWVSDDSTYVITFTAEPDLEAMAFQYSFVCNVTSPNTITSFTGTQRKASTTINDMNTSITVISLGFGLFGVIMAIVSCKWRSNDQKAKIKDDEAQLQALDERIQEARKKEAKERSEAVEDRCRKQMRADAAWPSDNYQETIREIVRRQIDTSPHQWKNSTSEIGNAILDGQQNSVVDAIRKDMLDAVKKEIIKGVSVRHLIEWEKRFMTYEDTGILKDGRIGELAQDIIEGELVSKIKSLQGGTSWIEDIFRETFNELLKEQMTKIRFKLGQRLTGIDLDMGLEEDFEDWEADTKLQTELTELRRARDPDETKKDELLAANKKIEKQTEMNKKKAEREKLIEEMKKRKELSDKFEKAAYEARTEAEKKRESQKLFEKHQ